MATTTQDGGRAAELLAELAATPGHPDPYPLYRELRALAPLHAVDGGWVAVTYVACDAALRHPATSCGSGFTPEHLATAMWRSASHWVMYQDGDRHRRVRGLLTRAFTARGVEGMRPYVGALVDDHLDRVAAAGGCELVAELALPVPITVIGELIGIPPADRHLFRDWSTAMLAVVADAAPAPDVVSAADRATIESEAYLRALVAERRAHPRDDLADALAAARDGDDRLTDDEVVANLNVVVGAGFETTVLMIGGGLLALLDHPDQLATARARPGAVRQVVEELLRYEAPVLAPNPRVATADLEVAGHPVAAGERIVVLPGAANRDPEHVTDPERLDVLRPDARPLAFGAGPHHCVGAALARMEIQEALGRLLARFPRVERLDAEVDWTPSHLFRGPRSLRVAVG